LVVAEVGRAEAVRTVVGPIVEVRPGVCEGAGVVRVGVRLGVAVGVRLGVDVAVGVFVRLGVAVKVGVRVGEGGVPLSAVGVEV
jgi:NF-X1-type zinc finger protein NFXL1